MTCTDSCHYTPSCDHLAEVYLNTENADRGQVYNLPKLPFVFQRDAKISYYSNNWSLQIVRGRAEGYETSNTTQEVYGVYFLM